MAKDDLLISLGLNQSDNSFREQQKNFWRECMEKSKQRISYYEDSIKKAKQGLKFLEARQNKIGEFDNISVAFQEMGIELQFGNPTLYGLLFKAKYEFEELLEMEQEAQKKTLEELKKYEQ